MTPYHFLRKKKKKTVNDSMKGFFVEDLNGNHFFVVNNYLLDMAFSAKLTNILNNEYSM